MKYSLTMGGILVSVIGTLLVQYGFSETCANELIQNVPLAIGAVMAWIGRVRAGGVNAVGFKK